MNAKTKMRKNNGCVFVCGLHWVCVVCSSRTTLRNCREKRGEVNAAESTWTSPPRVMRVPESNRRGSGTSCATRDIELAGSRAIRSAARALIPGLVVLRA